VLRRPGKLCPNAYEQIFARSGRKCGSRLRRITLFRKLRCDDLLSISVPIRDEPSTCSLNADGANLPGHLYAITCAT